MDEYRRMDASAVTMTRSINLALSLIARVENALRLLNKVKDFLSNIIGGVFREIKSVMSGIGRVMDKLSFINVM